MGQTSTNSTHGLDLSVSQQMLQSMQSDHRTQMQTLSEMHKADIDAMRAEHQASDAKFSEMFKDLTGFMKNSISEMSGVMKQCQQMSAMTTESYLGQMGKIIPHFL
jgi:hypothetical protein